MTQIAHGASSDMKSMERELKQVVLAHDEQM